MDKQINIRQEAITQTKREVNAWEEEVAFVTDKVAFNMRNFIRALRKNYWGVFDNAIDPVTGREKMWFPLSLFVVEHTVKNSDLDAKDMNVRAKKPSSIGVTGLVRSAMQNQLDEVYFGEKLNDLTRRISIDGTAVWKTVEVKENGKTTFEVRPVDLLNFYIDPTADSIESTPAIVERSLMLPDEVKAMEGWINTEQVEGETELNPNDPMQMSSGRETKFVEIFERWGKMPKSWMTGKEKDKEEMVMGHIVISNLHSGAEVHLIEEVKDKPYEECWFIKVPGRWHGMGPVEMARTMQVYLNTTNNIRINRALVTQLGIFKIKRGAGITPAMVSKMASNGAIMVNNLDDIDQFVMQEASQASYNDEQNAIAWAQRVTSVFESATGEQLPSSMPATNAVIQSRSAQASFVMIKESIGLFLQRWMKRHAMPIIQKSLTKQEIIRLTGSFEEVVDLDERLVNEMIVRKLEKANKKGQFIDPLSVEIERARALEKLRKMGQERYVELISSIDLTEYDVQFFVTNEEMDPSVTAQNLLSLMPVVPPQTQQVIVRRLMDLMGFDVAQFEMEQARGGNPMMQGQQAQLPPGQAPSQLPQEIFQQANVTPVTNGRQGN